MYTLSLLDSCKMYWYIRWRAYNIQLSQKQTDVTESKQWTCPKCTTVNNAEMFPFGLLSSEHEFIQFYA